MLSSYHSYVMLFVEMLRVYKFISIIMFSNFQNQNEFHWKTTE